MNNASSLIKDTGARFAFIPAAIFLVLSVPYVISGNFDALTFEKVLVIAAMTACVTMILTGLLFLKQGFGFDIKRPLSVYGVFFLIYYILPYLLLFYSNSLHEHTELRIALYILAGYFSFSMGVVIAGRPEKADAPIAAKSKAESVLLLVFCIIGIGFVFHVYAWRISNGIFFNQAMHYEQELTLSASFRDAFAMQFQLPLILMIGLLARVATDRIAAFARLLLGVYGVGIIFILIFSSQARLAFTALIFLFIAVRIYREISFRLKHAALMALAGVIAVLLVQGSRVTDAQDFTYAENQLTYALWNTVPNTLTAVSEFSPEIAERVIGRVSGGLDFFSEVIERTDDESYLFGRGILFSLYSLVPRAVWLNKPPVVSPQLIAEAMLNMPLYDAALGPVTQFYLEAGWTGVLAGFFIFGLAVGRITNFGARTDSIAVWLIVFFLWSHAVQVEQELIVGALGALRNGLIVSFFYAIAKYFIERRAKASKPA